MGLGLEEVGLEEVGQNHTDTIRVYCGNQQPTSSEDGTAKRWRVCEVDSQAPDLHQMELCCTFRGHYEHHHVTTVAATSALVLTGSTDCTARLWDTRGTELRMFIGGHRSFICHVSLCNSEEFGLEILTGDSNIIQVWGLKTWDEVMHSHYPRRFKSTLMALVVTRIVALQRPHDQLLGRLSDQVMSLLFEEIAQMIR